MSMTFEGEYGITIHSDNAIRIGHFPEAPGACEFGSCMKHGYYRAEIEHIAHAESLEKWFCRDHIQELLTQLVTETEFKRKVT